MCKKQISKKDIAFEKERVKFRKKIRELEYETEKEKREIRQLKEQLAEKESEIANLKDWVERLLTYTELSEDEMKKIIDKERTMTEIAEMVSPLTGLTGHFATLIGGMRF